jgi:hypothetical protein
VTRRRPIRTHRDRHGRGLRGPLAPAGVPLDTSRAAEFDDLVLRSMERLERLWPTDRAPVDLAAVELVVEDIPPPSELEGAVDGPMPLGAAHRGSARLGTPPQLVVYRRAIETRSTDLDRGPLVREVLAECVGDLFGMAPEDVDPEYG